MGENPVRGGGVGAFSARAGILSNRLGFVELSPERGRCDAAYIRFDKNEGKRASHLFRERSLPNDSQGSSGSVRAVMQHHCLLTGSASLTGHEQTFAFTGTISPQRTFNGCSAAMTIGPGLARTTSQVSGLTAPEVDDALEISKQTEV